MRWKDNYPDIGDEKVIEKFALFPIWIEGETRWMEKVRYKSSYRERARANRYGEYIFSGWVKTEFLENENNPTNTSKP